jgi:hypothetical protein
MNWIRTHPYASALGAAGLLLLVGAFIVERQSAAPVTSQTNAWGGAGVALLNPISATAPAESSQNGENIMQQVQSAAPYTYVPPTVLNPTGAAGADANQDDPFNYDAFVASLEQESAPAKSAPSGGGSSAASAYAFIPGGLISTTTAHSTRTKTQQDLYDYGNELGSYIQSFEQQNPNEAQVLTDQVQDRSDAGKAAAVEALGQALENVGNEISNMDTVPPQMASAHAALAKSYVEIGTKLALVPQAQRDSDFVSAIETYDTAADTFTKNYVAVANLFGAYGVTFAPDDPGSVFTFTPTSL